jgi:fumarate hydratase, class I
MREKVKMKLEFLELIRRTSSQLPDDVLEALGRATRREPQGSPARAALVDVLANCELASGSSRPLCQDTGTNIWYVYHPQSVGQREIERAVLAATRAATKKAYLRPNAVDSITGANSGDNTGIGQPVIHTHQWNKKSIHADLMLKGGGCENVSCQYSVPHAETGAGRDLEGIRRVVVDGVFQAQGRGCGPGILGVGVGGDRASSMVVAKEQLFRKLDDKNPDKTLAKLEARLMKDTNALGIGAMGFGGETTVLGVKIAKLHRLPASFYVSIAYMCWACRRASVTITGKGASYSQLAEIAKRYELPKPKKTKARRASK